MSPDGQHVALVPGWRENRSWVVSVLVKRSYRIGAEAGPTRVEEPAPFQKADVYRGDGNPESSSVLFETELVPYKPRTDVVVIGSAHAPGGEATSTFVVRLAFGEHQHRLRITGPRTCRHNPGRPPTFTDPEPIDALDLCYEYAYGGGDLHSDPDAPFFYPRNPIGRGFAVSNVREQVDGLRLPSIEDPLEPVTPERLLIEERTSWNEAPLPRGFAWYQRNWYPRCSFAGSVPPYAPTDRPMREEALGLVPEDQVALSRSFRLPSFDPRLNNGASLGLALEDVVGGEPIVLENLTPEGRLAFSLPTERPRIGLDFGSDPVELEARLQTVCIRTAASELDLIWSGSYDISGPEWLARAPRLVAEVK